MKCSGHLNVDIQNFTEDLMVESVERQIVEISKFKYARVSKEMIFEK